MYLKSIEMHGFKSFANKIVFDFHNGITGIVGPNGSGKSNVADAVRWVLGEQSAKQLRGASMQDVIFAGTESRKPLSYAYVAITMDNSDHLLPVDFEEVTIARRVYRSGESEYLLNGVACRLKDVNELFYDTGIGKEGYSIIGQGQIEKILSGKPEERRELFDEAVGIVKFKKRKAATVKKLEEERENLIRVNDILSELERQVGPLERQAETAKAYLKKKEELRNLDVNMFLLEVERLTGELETIRKNGQIAENELNDNRKKQEEIHEQYSVLEQSIKDIDEQIENIRLEQTNTTSAKSKLENQISILEEQIKSAEASDESLAMRRGVLEVEKEEHTSQLNSYNEEKEELEKTLAEVTARLEQATADYNTLQEEIKTCNEGIEKNNQEIIRLLNEKANIKSKEQHLKTMLEQTNIRKAELTQKLLQSKTAEASLVDELTECEKAYEKSNEAYASCEAVSKELEQKKTDFKLKRVGASEDLQRKTTEVEKDKSKLESLKNIAERYDGFGNSIRRVMEQKASNPGLIGVVSDFINVDKKYEVAIETALGGNIQNIVTEDEKTAKDMIAFLKKNHFGRATFLPLTSVEGKGGLKSEDALSENGVIGLASDLVEADSKYKGVLKYLLGRVIVADTIDHAISIAKKYHYSLHIVTLEGEYLSPGGSMTGGAFKNNSNLLSRKREIEELEERLAKNEKELEELKNRLSDIDTAIALAEDDLANNQKELQELALARNTAGLNLARAKEQKEKANDAFSKLNDENQSIENEISDINAGTKSIKTEMENAEKREEELKKEIEEFQETLDAKTYMETSSTRVLSEIQIEEANIRQKVSFVIENIARVTAELEKDNANIENLLTEAKTTKEEAVKKRSDIEEIKKTIIAADENASDLIKKLEDAQAKKEAMNAEYKGFFDKREEIANRINDLDKEIFRLNSQKEKAEGSIEFHNNYMWEEYELTFHNAMEYKNDEYTDSFELKKMVSSVKDEIKRMGNVNVNAIEEYKEVSERYEFLKGQHDDLIEAEQTLMGIIDELDAGMREQFSKGFATIQVEFDKAFKELFGGGKGTLELVEGEDILETGIKIIAQPPGKKLQNMMQLSGGEKSLTAIALLFAIQNMKPSPFCLLDEIEAALDDSNVDRFAKYLHKLTKNTQFIIITHRRGTMNAADRLYGITMQEKGVSTLVSVNLIENDLDE